MRRTFVINGSPFTLIFCALIVLNNNYFAPIKIYFKPIQMVFKLYNFFKTPAEGQSAPSDPPLPLTLATLAFPLIVFATGIMSDFKVNKIRLTNDVGRSSTNFFAFGLFSRLKGIVKQCEPDKCDILLVSRIL